MSDIAEVPLIVTVAPNGARRTSSDHPMLPITPDEIAMTAAACCEAGAAMIHLHVRDRDGGHTLDPDAYRAATTAIRDEVGDRMIVQITTEAVGRYRPAEQMASVRAVRPEAVSLALRELVPTATEEGDAGAFFAWIGHERIAPQFILYDEDDVRRLIDLQKRGILHQDRPNALFVLGRYTKRQRSDPRDLLPFLSTHAPFDWPWTVCAFGPRENACMVAAAALGGHCRVGFENNLTMVDGTMAPDNAALVRQVATIGADIGRSVADATCARRIFAGRQ